MPVENGLNFQQACDAHFSDELTKLMRESAYARLLLALQTGALKATGVRTLPTVELKRSPIPAFVFDKPRIDWFTDIVENAGSRFEQVRIHRSEASLDGQMGRPSEGPRIVRYLRELLAEGVDLSGNQKRICDLVRSKARYERASLKGLSDPVIKTHIRRLRTPTQQTD